MYVPLYANANSRYVSLSVLPCGRLTRQMLTEALLLCSLGTLLGIVLIWVRYSCPWSKVAPSNVPRLDSTSLDLRVILFSSFCGIFGSAFLGMLPSSYLARSRIMRSPADLRKEWAVVHDSVRQIWSRHCGGGHSFHTAHWLRAHVSQPCPAPACQSRIRSSGSPHVSHNRRRQGRLLTSSGSPFYGTLEDRLRSIPGVQSVGGATGLPLHVVGPPDGVQWSAEQIPEDPKRRVDLETVLPGYFEALHSRVLEGRTFSEADNANGQAFAVIDQSLARKVFPNQSAVDRRICVYIPDPTWLRIIGVVEHQRLHTLAHTGPEQIFVTDGFSGIGISRQWALRTVGDPQRYASLVRSEIAKFAPGRLAISEMQTMNMTIKDQQIETRFSFLLIAPFAFVAAFLSIVGLYGVVSSAVRQRTAEIGLRIAFGAEPGTVVRLMIGRGLILGSSRCRNRPIGLLRAHKVYDQHARRYPSNRLRNVCSCLCFVPPRECHSLLGTRPTCRNSQSCSRFA